MREIALVVSVVFATINISACNTIAGYFPDKEKDYHYHEELPELELPPDLQPKAGKRQYISDDDKFVKQSDNATIGTDPIAVRMVNYDDGSVRIQIDSSLKITWPIVGKALSRNLIEITDRNRSEAVYVVRYDPDAKKYEDGTIGDEFEFFFSDNPRQEKEYHIRLAEDKNLTEVMVTDEDENPLSEGDGIKLLNTVYETIMADQQKKAQE